MVVKLLEIRDAATFIPCIAISIEGSDGFLARRAGYEFRCILFGKLRGGEMHYSPFDWEEFPRTMHQAHIYIAKNWDVIKDDDVIDVEFILGETTHKKISEIHHNIRGIS